jgi:glyoxylase-like metal-dependent hydrolase (beta-lactamase superfamily II)
MAYTGLVTPGGPSDVRELPRATIRKMSVSDLDNNVYLLTCTATGHQMLIDAAEDPARCLGLVADGTGRLDHLVTTHAHSDHVRALAEVARATGATTYAGADDAAALPCAPDVPLHHGDIVTVGELVVEVIHLRGHTPGSVALSWRDPGPDGITHLFTGDALFPGGVGRTSDPGQSFTSLYRDVVERIFATHADDTWFYPGHGADSTLGAQRPHLDQWRVRGW